VRPLRVYTLVRRSSRSDPMPLGCGAVLMVILAAALLAGAGMYAGLTANLPSPELLPVLLNPEQGILMQPTRLYDRTGEHILFTLENSAGPRHYLWLDPIQPEHFSPLLVQVIVSAIDPSFWSHPGVTWQSLAAAGPVTLAERLVDRLMLDPEPAGWQRNFRMRLLATQVTARFGRAQVLEWYLNSVYFGHLAYGADSAARLYLNKSASNLNLQEVTMLVAAQEAPALNPMDAPKAALERQQVVLDELLEKGIINAQDYLQARTQHLERSVLQSPASQVAGAFSRMVLDELEQRLGRDRLERGGLRILTSLDYDLQSEVECAARTQLQHLQGKQQSVTRLDGKACASARLLPTLPPGSSFPPEQALASAVVFDLQKGEVLAYVGPVAANGQEGSTPVYQPGSLLTPFVALAGFARGMSPASLVWDIPSNLPKENQDLGSKDMVFHGPVRLRQALANDYLTPFAQMLSQFGAVNVWRLSEPLGLHLLDSSQKPEELFYGGGYATLMDITQAYETFANMGVQVGETTAAGASPHPVLVRSVNRIDGQILIAEPQAEPVSVLSAPLAYLVHHILSDDAARQESLGTPNPLEIGQPSAGKVGRTADGKQVWTAGYTPQRLVVTWFGLPYETNAGRLDEKLAAGLWYAAVQESTRGLPITGWREPAGISHLDVCDPSGMLPTPACPNLVDEVFLNGTEPVERDTLYQIVQINRETGRLATVFTPPALVEEKTFLIPPAEALDWAKQTRLPQPPVTYDAIQAGSISKDVQIDQPPVFAYVHGKVALHGTAAGDGFSSYRIQVGQGLNPQAWVQVGEEGKTAVEQGSLGIWDTTGMDGLYAVRLQVIRQDNRVETATAQVTVDNLAPEVKLTYPESGQVFTFGQQKSIILQAQVTDNIGVTRLEWYMDGQRFGETVQPPYSMPWTMKAGSHRLVLKAYDPAGNISETSPFELIVK
jgi:membrane peptidoglycan carboxypeptidase